MMKLRTWKKLCIIHSSDIILSDWNIETCIFWSSWETLHTLENAIHINFAFEYEKCQLFKRLSLKARGLFPQKSISLSQTADISVLKTLLSAAFPKSARPIHHDGSKLCPNIRPHGQKHQALELHYCKAESRRLFRINSLCEGSSEHKAFLCAPSVSEWLNMHQTGKHDIQKASDLKLDRNRASSNGRSTNGPLRWPAPGQAKETLDTFLTSRWANVHLRHCSLSEEHPVGLSCGLVTTGFWETSSDHKLMNVPLSEHSTDVGEVMC